MNSPQRADSVIHDLRDISPEQLAALGDSVLARALSLYSERRSGQMTLRTFNSSI